MSAGEPTVDTDLGEASTVHDAAAPQPSTPKPTRARKRKTLALAGTRLADRYDVIERIGVGGMGEVYLAEHSTIGKRLAIKALTGDASERPDLADRFLHEARAASSIGHPNVVDITDFGYSSEGVPFFAMELLEGETLGATVERGGALPWPRVRKITLQILAALGAAHEQGIVHRDMKPDNCFRLTRGGDEDFIKVLDFGIAKIVSDDVDKDSLTQTGAVIGTAYYMSPEQARSEKLDARADLYSVGVVMYQLLTGEVPFRSSGFMGVLAKHITEPIPPMAEVAPEVVVHPKVEAIVRRALAKKREDRYQSADDFAAAIRALPEELGAVRSRRALGWLAGVGAAAIAALGWITMGHVGSEQPQEPSDAGSVPEPAPAKAPAADPEPAPPRTDAPDRPPTAIATVGFAGVAETGDDETETGDDGDDQPKKTIPDKLDKADMRWALSTVKRNSRRCSEEHGGLYDSVVVEFTVAPSGEVEDARVPGTMKGVPAAMCATDALEAQRFPKSKRGGSASVRLPLKP